MEATLSELKRTTKAVMRPVIHAGETVVVTDHGKPVAEVRPARPRGKPAAEVARAWLAIPKAIRDRNAKAWLAGMEAAGDVAD